jgi:DNA-binding transcriptional ArsR family regulator
MAATIQRTAIGEWQQAAQVFRALGDETRLRLVAELAQRGEVTCGEFAAMCACSNSALTYHQRVLSEAGLITVRRRGQYRVLTLRPDTLEAFMPGYLDYLTQTAMTEPRLPSPDRAKDPIA